MAGYRGALTNFSKGELSDHLLGRFDVAAYNSGLKRARNVIILKYGGVTKRPGMKLVAEAFDATEPVRLVPFTFSFEQTYALEFGQAYMRPVARGGMVLNEELEITGISIANGATITAAYHDYAEGDQVLLRGIEGELGDLLNDRIWNVTDVVNDNEFKVDANTTGLDAFTAAEGGITRVAPPDPPPTPPVVPPVVPPPEPPPVYAPGHGYYQWDSNYEWV